MMTGPASAAFFALPASWLNWRLERVVMVMLALPKRDNVDTLLRYISADQVQILD
jgi:hypothetical protein